MKDPFVFVEYDGTHVLVTRTNPAGKTYYRSRFLASTYEEASEHVANLNRHLRKEELAAHRYDVEVGDISIDGLTIKTDRTSQSSLTNAYMSMKEGFFTDTDWKGADGWALVTLEQITPIAQAVGLHVRLAFKAERMVNELIDAITDHEEMDSLDVRGKFNEFFTTLTGTEEEEEDPIEEE